MHVIEKMAVKRPVSWLVGGEIELGEAAGLHDHRVLLWLAIGRCAVDELEEMTVKVDRVRHHGVVDQLDPNPFVIGKADRLVAGGDKFSQSNDHM